MNYIDNLIELAKEIGNIDPMELLKLTETTVSEEEFEEQMSTIEGINFLAHLSLKYNHPDLTLKDVMFLLTPN
ncbi:hypothetical protein LCGC14_2369450, partial [marine sediment metagenome]